MDKLERVTPGRADSPCLSLDPAFYFPPAGDRRPGRFGSWWGRGPAGPHPGVGLYSIWPPREEGGDPARLSTPLRSPDVRGSRGRCGLLPFARVHHLGYHVYPRGRSVSAGPGDSRAGGLGAGCPWEAPGGGARRRSPLPGRGQKAEPPPGAGPGGGAPPRGGAEVLVVTAPAPQAAGGCACALRPVRWAGGAGDHLRPVQRLGAGLQ